MTEAQPRDPLLDPPADRSERGSLDDHERGARDPDPKKQKKHSLLTQITELPILVLFAFAIAVLIKTFLVQAFFIPSESMLPTLEVGDRVLVEKLSYRFGEPERGDVVVFARTVFGGEHPDVPWYQDARNFLRELLGLPTGLEEDYIKRIVGTEGDVIAYTGKPRQLTVNGKPVDERSHIHGGEDLGSTPLNGQECKRLRMEKVDEGCRVPTGKVFVMGDNRSNSEDSRVIGPIEEAKIVGHAFVVLWPIGNFGGI
jgi:signal peptidase I